MAKPSSTELLAEFEAAKKTAKGLFRQAAKSMPGAVAVTQQAIDEALGSPPYDVAYIKDNFSALVHDLQTRAYGLYLEAERSACGPILAEFVAKNSSQFGSDGLPHSFSDSFFVLDRFCLSLTQSRRTRAGTAFETVVTTLFEALQYPYTAQPELSGSKPDFVLPSVAHYAAFATDCLILTFNETLREAAHQIYSDHFTGRSFYLATNDDSISEIELERMKSRGIHAVVPTRTKLEFYPNAMNVIDFECFFDYHVDPSVKRWSSYRSNQIAC